MNHIQFKSTSICNEINLNKIAGHFGIKKKFEWEDFVRLGSHQLKGVLKEPDNKTIILFAFGSVVFINMQHHEMVDSLSYLAQIDQRLEQPNFEFSDDYRLSFDPRAEEKELEERFTNDSMTMPEYAFYQMEILAIVLAKSVALERIEADTEKLLDEIEPVIDLLQKGNLSSRDEKIANISARILGFKYSTISSIMLLDKPDITWNNSKAEELYGLLSHLFELDERYNKIQMKTNTLMDIVQVFTSLTQHRKANTLEWMIIILIVIEIILSLIDFALFKM